MVEPTSDLTARIRARIEAESVPDPVDVLLGEVRTLSDLLAEKKGGPTPPRSWWIERLLAFVGICLLALFGWVWNMERRVAHIESTRIPSTTVQAIQNDMAVVREQVVEIKRRLDRMEAR